MISGLPTLPLLIVFAWIVLTICSPSWDAWVAVDDWILSITSTQTRANYDVMKPKKKSMPVMQRVIHL